MSFYYIFPRIVLLSVPKWVVSCTQELNFISHGCLTPLLSSLAGRITRHPRLLKAPQMGLLQLSVAAIWEDCSAWWMHKKATHCPSKVPASCVLIWPPLNHRVAVWNDSLALADIRVPGDQELPTPDLTPSHTCLCSWIVLLHQLN